MKWTEYAERGYYYADYLKLSQWQRFMWFFHRCRASKNRVSISLVVRIWPLSVWRLGIDCSQEYDHFCLGPFELVVGI